MALLATKGKAPGVYIQEITIPGPIALAATSITAIVGPASKGPLFTPTQLTSINDFWTIFGSYVDDPYRVYAAHTVNGFFAEGGTNCYFVRVGTGVQATLNLKDRSGKSRTSLVATALNEGVSGNNITVKVDAVNIASTKAVQPANVTLSKADAGSTQATTANANDSDNFKPGDAVLLTNGANSERAWISSIGKDTTANTTTFNFVAPLGNDYANGTLRVADLIPGQAKIRVLSAVGIETGSYVQITQGAVTEAAVVRVVDQTNGFLTLTKPLANTYTVKNGDADVTVVTQEFTLTIANGALSEVFANLAIDPRHSRYFSNVIASALVSVDVADPPTVSVPPNNLPVALAATNLGSAAGTAGVDEDLTKLTTASYLKGIDTLQKIGEVRLLCVPDAVGSQFKVADTQAIQAYMVAHCEKMQDRFAILDSAPIDFTNDPTFTAVVQQRQNLNSDNGYAALYFPWIGISNPAGNGTILVPPSGHTAGVYANNDNLRGVFKAPANEQITSALSVEALLSDDEQGPKNDLGINVIRKFPSQGVKIWGARTITSPDALPWRFVNVRRLLLAIETSIKDGTQFAVFEPNNVALWQQIKRMVNDFLMDQWKDGALFGDTPDKAFRVRVDETLNPPDIRAQGILVVEVTVVPTTPAEFIIFQVVQDITGSTLQETAS